MSIVVKNLTKKYGTQRAVDNISFEVKTGEVVGFLGPNGAGKTTSMKIITCFMAPTDGDVSVNGHSIHENQSEIKKRIGYLPESNPLYYDMPVMEYLEFSAKLQGVQDDLIPERLAEMVHLTGLNKEKHKRIGELSKGYKQRVGLAQAMVHDPEILILDEPTTGLDPNQRIEIRKLIRDLGKEKTVILSTHILSEVEETCDRILIINNGKIVADGTSEKLRNQARGGEVLRLTIEDIPSRDEVISTISKMDTVDMVDIVEGNDNAFIVNSTADVSNRRDLFKLCVEKNWVLTELTPIETKLEDIFRDLTKN